MPLRCTLLRPVILFTKFLPIQFQFFSIPRNLYLSYSGLIPKLYLYYIRVSRYILSINFVPTSLLLPTYALSKPYQALSFIMLNRKARQLQTTTTTRPVTMIAIPLAVNSNLITLVTNNPL